MSIIPTLRRPANAASSNLPSQETFLFGKEKPTHPLLPEIKQKVKKLLKLLQTLCSAHTCHTASIHKKTQHEHFTLHSHETL